MLVREVGEARLVEILAEALGVEPGPSDRPGAHGFRLKMSIGDDAAAWDGPSATTVATSDAMVDGVHFRLDQIGWSDLGWKALAVNLSDIAAMGCAPLYSTVSLGLPGHVPVSGLVEMYGAMAEASSIHGGEIVGGDVVRSPVLFVAVSMFGVAPPQRGGPPPGGVLLTRGSAAAGDSIAVTGSLGCSAGGLRMLREGGEGFDPATVAHLRRAHDRPTPRVSEGTILARHGVVAAIDISDGLVVDLSRVCRASGLAARVHADLVPVDTYLRSAYPDEHLSLALTGGEDYELLFTAPPEVLEEAAAHLDVPATVIGQIVEGPSEVSVLDEDGAPIPIERGGWDHFGPEQ